MRARELNWACYESCGGLLSGQQRLWLPVLVEGVSHGYNWGSASLDAHTSLHRFCSLLSLETDWYWMLRNDARTAGKQPLVRPILPMGGIRPCSVDEERELRERKVTIDVQRMEAAWNRRSADASVQIPLSAYYEGMGLTEEHPSFALVAFVSAIEEVGRLHFEEEVPPTCEKCGQREFNSKRRLFIKTLESLSESPEKAKRMAQELYRWRSSTAHSGHVDGLEKTLGRRPYCSSGLDLRPEDEFYIRGVWSAKETARTLLMKLLSGDIACR